MTPAELNVLVEAQNELRKDEWWRFGWFTVKLLTPYLRKGQALEVADVLPAEISGRPAAKKPKTKDEARKIAAAQREELEAAAAQREELKSKK